mmetsp:Transcript_11054/g.37563  ORF Transcript_11054/g.37563 Transcript_11054/m.37563 type:complete len:128 (+) Transcript_11054:1003-1386(+)
MQTNNVIFPVTPVTELNMQINAGADPHVPCNQVRGGGQGGVKLNRVQVEMMDFDRTSFQMHQVPADWLCHFNLTVCLASARCSRRSARGEGQDEKPQCLDRDGAGDSQRGRGTSLRRWQHDGESNGC